MNNTNSIAINELRNLMRVNYERMIAFEQASFNIAEPALKQYFEAKAEESEMNIAELNEVVSSLSGERFEVENLAQQNMLGTTPLFTGKKDINAILKNIAFLEKTIIRWYKNGIKNLKGMSQGFGHILNKHSLGLEASHVYVQSC
jgi:hypothetical protein